MPTDQGNATVGLTQVPPGAAPGPFNATEERILDATLRLLGRRGVRRLAMSEISEAAGISRGTLYRYFPSKEHVLIGVAAYDEQRFTDGMAKALAPVPDALARVEAFVAFSFDYIREHPARASSSSACPSCGARSSSNSVTHSIRCRRWPRAN
jgi:AcrR family transcriptional regulator